MKISERRPVDRGCPATEETEIMDQDQDQERARSDSNRLDDDGVTSPAELDSRLQPDLELTEGPASRSRIAAYAAVIVLVLAAVLYGLTNANRQNSNPAAQTTQSETSPPHGAGNAAGPNGQPGATTGSATNR